MTPPVALTLTIFTLLALLGCSGAQAQTEPVTDALLAECSKNELRVRHAEGCEAPWLEEEAGYWRIALRVFAKGIVERRQATPEDLYRILRFSVVINSDGTVSEVTPTNVPPLPEEMKKALNQLTVMPLVHPPGVKCVGEIEWNGACAQLPTDR